MAGQGTAFGEGHVKELVNLGLREVFLALDPDEAGQEATRKIGDLFQREGIEVRVLALPPGLDPDAFLRKNGPAAFLTLLENALDYLTFLVKHESRKTDLKSPAGKSDLVQRLTRQIRDWNQPLMVHESLRKLAHLLQVPETMITSEAAFTNIYIKKTGSIGQLDIDPDRILEADLLRWLLFFPHFLPRAQANLAPDAFSNPLCRKFYEAFLTTSGQSTLALMSELQDEESSAFLTELMHKKINKEKAEATFLESLQKILDRNWMQKREEVKMRIQSGQCSDDEALELAKQFETIRKSPPKVKV